MKINNKILETYNNTCYIVGGGSSLKSFNWNHLKDPNKFVVVINNAFLMLPNANILYCTDDPWIEENKNELTKFNGTIYQGVLPHHKIPKADVIDERWLLTGFDGIETKDKSLRHGSNSTYAALNLVTVHLGFSRVFLLGIDMKWGMPGNHSTSHWHSHFKPHSRIDPESIYSRMMLAYTSIKPELDKRNIEVYNVNSENTTNLKTFPIISYNEMMEKEREFGQ